MNWFETWHLCDRCGDAAQAIPEISAPPTDAPAEDSLVADLAAPAVPAARAGSAKKAGRKPKVKGFSIDDSLRKIAKSSLREAILEILKDESNFSKDYSVVADMALDLLKSRDQKCWGELTGYTRRRTLKDSFFEPRHGWSLEGGEGRFGSQTRSQR